MNKIGDKFTYEYEGRKYNDIINGFDGDRLKVGVSSYLYYKEDYIKNFINLSERGRKAAASTAKKVRRDEKGRFTTKQNIISFMIECPHCHLQSEHLTWGNI